ncbi:hypothetical protein TWF173_003416 [Orbilia oligospora]|nr:hypothetical protein TWF173_003416 [Orbilia oligospora]
MVDPSEICTLMPLDEDTQYGNTQANDNSNDFLGNLIRRKYMGTGDTATMNLALNDHTTTERVRAVVLHEFGHLLGCIHEHSSPASSIPWNEEAVYDFYKRTNGWDRAKTCHNVLHKYDRNTVSQFSEFDPKSIMIYTIDESVLLPGNSRFVTSWNTRLSTTDKEFIGKLYPFPEGEERPGRSTRIKQKRL